MVVVEVRKNSNTHRNHPQFDSWYDRVVVRSGELHAVRARAGTAPERRATSAKSGWCKLAVVLRIGEAMASFRAEEA